MSPPAGCYCIPGGPGVGCYRHIKIPARCGDWDNHGYSWCYVSGCCGEKNRLREIAEVGGQNVVC